MKRLIIMRLTSKDRLFVLTGAGVSAESGLATFRGSGGLWNGYRVEDVATPEAWEADPKHTAPPELMGQLFHLFDSPNRFGLPAFYTLHVWAWKDNPNGTFTNWNPDVSCDGFAGEKP